MRKFYQTIVNNPKKILVCFQFRVGLRYRHETAHSAGQLCVGLHLPLRVCCGEITASGIS